MRAFRMTAIRGKPIERQIEVYEEEWLRDHQEAVRCGDLEEVLAVGIGIYTALEHINSVCRANVSRGIDEYCAEDGQAIQGMFQRWLRVCERAVPQIALCEERFGSVELAAEFRVCQQRAQQTLARWVAPVKQRALGLVVDSLSEEEGRRLDEVLRSGEARLRITPRPSLR
jgi:hypothetical protein